MASSTSPTSTSSLSSSCRTNPPAAEQPLIQHNDNNPNHHDNHSSSSPTPSANTPATLIQHNGQLLTVAAARHLLDSHSAELRQLESAQAASSAAIQAVLHRRNAVSAQWQRTGRLIYKCELHNSLARDFQLQCDALRAAEERCMRLERELCALETKIRRAERAERAERKEAKRLKQLMAKNRSGLDNSSASARDATLDSTIGSAGTTPDSSANGSMLSLDEPDGNGNLVGGGAEDGAAAEADFVDGVTKEPAEYGDEDGELEADEEEGDYYDDEDEDEDDDELGFNFNNLSFYDGLSTSV